MRRAANFFKLDSSESDTDEERKKSSKVTAEKAVVNTDAAKRETGKRKRVDDIDLGAEENTRDKSKKKMKPTSVDSEVEENILSSKKRKKKKPSEDPEVEGNSNSGGAKDANQIQSENPEAEGNELKSTKDPKKKGKKNKKKPSEDPEVEVNNKGSTEDAEKKQSEDSEAEGNDLNSKKDPKKKGKKNKKKQSEDPEAEGDDLNLTENAEKKQSENSEAEGNDLNSTEIAKKKRKKKKQSEDPEVEENNNDGAKDAEKNQSEDSEAEGNGLNSTEIAKKKRKKKNKESEDPEVKENNNDGAKDAEKNQSEDSEAEGNGLNSTEIAQKKKKKKKKQSEDPEAEENNGKKKKKKQKGNKSDEVVTTPSSKSAKKVKFSDQVEVFPTEDEESDEDDEEEEVGVVRGKRFTKEEDELIKKSVFAYVDNHALGDEGVNMILDCKSHKQVRGCWKEIAAALPWRPYVGVYHRAHTIFEQGSKGIWSKEDLELVIQFQKKHGNDWKTLADAMGKNRKHVKDAWRRIRLASKKNGHWSMGEYQNLFDLVNKDLRIKAFREKRSQHGMLRDNIPWMAISDEIGTRDHVICCHKWYDQLTSPMVKKGIWANVDDYRLLDELTRLDAACVDDVDWDDLLENRDGDACRNRWNQMVHHIGKPGTKTFAEQVEILSQRYCPDIAEDREDFDNRPFDPEDEED